jgi:hydroxymethylbilane synthase
MSARILRIGTRGSQLALWQARTVADLLARSGLRAELVVMKTSGDRLQEAPLSEGGGKRLFVKEIEDALLKEEVDLAVHSAKDMPAVLPEGLEVAATLAREDPRDALVLPSGAPQSDLAAVRFRLGDGPTIATSSIRRIAQLAALFPRATFSPIRGNVDTRLRKLDAGDCDALVLAAAGLRRLGFGARLTVALPVEGCVPAPGQGIVAVEIRAGDGEARQGLQAIHDEAAGASLAAERTLVRVLGGGCQLPLGALALHVDGDLELHGLVASPDGRRIIRAHGRGPSTDPAGLGRRIADDLARQGATAILDEVRFVQRPVEGSY